MNEGTTTIETGRQAPVVPQSAELKTPLHVNALKPQLQKIADGTTVMDEKAPLAEQVVKEEKEPAEKDQTQEVTDKKTETAEKTPEENIREELKELDGEKPNELAEKTENAETTENDIMPLKKEKKEKDRIKLMTDIMTQLWRIMRVTMAMLKLLIFKSISQTDADETYSGDELNLPVEAPNKDTEDKLVGMGLQDKNSTWSKLVGTINKIKNTTFSDLLARALDIVQKITPLKIKSEDKNDKTEEKKPSGLKRLFSRLRGGKKAQSK